MTQKTVFKEIPISQLMRQANGVPKQEYVYFFSGRNAKKQDFELEGQEYAWAKDIQPEGGE